ncbi:YdcF family protein [Pandoraea pneumonica]|uniref:YdcF family protein n=1 Tax=Pandoraea pneumonica TaxID=2508299 RepID=A0A5E4TV83_9BURK|nr:YdcF family protein [Pandoraea pneumonica]VVD91687.1 YdcF family protein [Pandoraea pneumonica]
MTLAALIVIAALACFFRGIKWRRTSVTLFSASAILFLAIGCGVVPKWLLGTLQSRYAAKPAIAWGEHNVIVLLGAGTQRVAGVEGVEPGSFSYPRFVAAVEEYQACHQAKPNCVILVSGGDARKTGQSEAAVYQDSLARMGVPVADIRQEPKSMNTWQNAQFTADLLKEYGADRVVIVSSGFHLQRGALYFSHFGVKATLVRGDYLQATSSFMPVAYNFTLTDVALHEYIGIARYHAYNALGWNPERTQPGQA